MTNKKSKKFEELYVLFRTLWNYVFVYIEECHATPYMEIGSISVFCMGAGP